MGTEELPDVIERLRAWLVDQGFREDERRYDRLAFGNWLIVLAGDSCRVRLVRDRSQWFIDVSGGGLADWYDTDLWHACLEGSDAPARVIPLDDEIAFLRTSLPAVTAALGSPAELERCLRSQRTARADRRGRQRSDGACQ